MKKYQHRAVDSENTTEIKSLGKQGYRIVAATEDVVYMEREILDNHVIESD